MLVTAKELITKSIDLYRNNWKLFVRYLLLIAALFVVSITALSLAFPLGIVIVGMLGNSAMTVFLLLLIMAIFGLLFAALGVVVNIAFTRAVHQAYIGATPSKLMDALKESIKVFWKVVGVSIVASFYAAWPLMLALLGYATSMVIIGESKSGLSIMMLVFGLLVIYGIFHVLFYSLKLAFSFYETAIYGTGIRASITFSKDATKNRWWRILWRLIAPAVVFYVVVLAYMLVVAVLGKLVGGNSAFIGFVTYILLTIGQMLSVPLFMSAIIILFHHVKTDAPESSPTIESTPEATPTVESTN